MKRIKLTEFKLSIEKMGKKKTRRRQAHEIEDEIEKNEEEKYRKVSEQSNSEIEKLKQSKSRNRNTQNR